MSAVKDTFPPHLSDLLHWTPSSSMKLIAAWDGLSLENRSQALSQVLDSSVSTPRKQATKVALYASKDTNPYIRYLAAKILNRHSNDKDISAEISTAIEVLKSDSDPLVSFAGDEEDEFIYPPTPSKFWQLPQEARLALVRNALHIGEEFAELIIYAKERKTVIGVTEGEIEEILEDCCNKPSFKEHFENESFGYDGWAEHSAGRDARALWELSLKVHEQASHILINNLPEQYGFMSTIPQNVLDAFSPRQMMTLLFRPEIGLHKLRKEIYFKGQKEEEWKYAASAAQSYNFTLSYNEFAEILAMPDGVEKVHVLSSLGHCRDLNLCIYEAIHDALFAMDVGAAPHTIEEAEWANHSFEQKINNLSGYEKEKELDQLRLYRLAKQSSPWKDEEAYSLSDELSFLGNLVRKKDPWGTFMSFSKEWEKTGTRAKKRLKPYMPYIDEAGEEDPFDYINFGEDDEPKDPAIALLSEKMDAGLNEIMSLTRGLEEGDNLKATVGAIAKSTKHLGEAQQQLLSALHTTTNQLNVKIDAMKPNHLIDTLILVGMIGLLIKLW